MTKIFQIDPKLTFNVLHILNHGRISKIEKFFDGTDPPAKKAFFWGVSGGLKAKDSGMSRNDSIFLPRRTTRREFS